MTRTTMSLGQLVRSPPKERARSRLKNLRMSITSPRALLLAAVYQTPGNTEMNFGSADAELFMKCRSAKPAAREAWVGRWRHLALALAALALLAAAGCTTRAALPADSSAGASVVTVVTSITV